MTNALNYCLYQAGWLACVLGAASGRPWGGAALAAALVVAHLLLVRNQRSELALVAASGVLGAAAESVLLQFELASYASPIPLAKLAPVWIVVLWLQFATLLRWWFSVTA